MFSHMREHDKIRKIEEHGREVYEILSGMRNEEEEPMMIPPAPESKHYDIFNTEERSTILEGSEREANTLRQQVEWEAEVEVYRELENLNEDIVVIHSFKRATCMYSLFGSEIQANVDGETDFLVIGINYIAICEVKAPAKGWTSSNFCLHGEKASKQLDSTYAKQNNVTNITLRRPPHMSHAVLRYQLKDIGCHLTTQR